MRSFLCTVVIMFFLTFFLQSRQLDSERKINLILKENSDYLEFKLSRAAARSDKLEQSVVLHKTNVDITAYNLTTAQTDLDPLQSSFGPWCWSQIAVSRDLESRGVAAKGV